MCQSVVVAVVGKIRSTWATLPPTASPHQIFHLPQFVPICPRKKSARKQSGKSELNRTHRSRRQIYPPLWAAVASKVLYHLPAPFCIWGLENRLDNAHTLAKLWEELFVTNPTGVWRKFARRWSGESGDFEFFKFWKQSYLRGKIWVKICEEAY